MEIRASCLIQRRRQEILRGVASQSKDCLNVHKKRSTDDPADVCTRPRGGGTAGIPRNLPLDRRFQCGDPDQASSFPLISWSEQSVK